MRAQGEASLGSQPPARVLRRGRVAKHGNAVREGEEGLGLIRSRAFGGRAVTEHNHHSSKNRSSYVYLQVCVSGWWMVLCMTGCFAAWRNGRFIQLVASCLCSPALPCPHS